MFLLTNVLVYYSETFAKGKKSKFPYPSQIKQCAKEAFPIVKLLFPIQSCFYKLEVNTSYAKIV